MEFNDFSKGKIWAIHPNYLENMLVKIPEIKTAGDLAIKFTENPEERGDFMLRDGVAIIPMNGPLSKRSSFMSFFFGGASMTYLAQVYAEALADPDVEAIVLDIDSPGGTVSGTEAFGDFVFNARTKKPVVAFANGMMASAAYWIGSGAQKIVVERTADVGSIGVVMVHYDFSKMDEKYGVKRTVLSAGKYKALGNSTEPLTDIARKMFESDLDYIYTLFVNTVARNRDTDPEAVLENMADGRIYIGQQAVDAGLADMTGSLDTAIEAAQDLIPEPQTSYFFYQSQKKESIMNDKKIEIPKTVAELAAAFPDLASELKQQGADSVNLEEVRTEAASAERDRILGLAAIQFGEEAGEKFKAVVETCVTVDQFKAIRATQPKGSAEDPDAKAKILEALHNTGAPDPGLDAQGNLGTKTFLAQVDEHVALHKCSKTEAIRAVMKKDPKAHAAYIQSVN